MKILLGFEVDTGNEVYMENHHSVVTGMTQLSGKTTTLEALVDRGDVKAIAFLTKRGEGGFRNQREIPAYFREQKKGTLIDWQYVSAILEATMSERMKFERSWIIKACHGAKDLQEVYNNIKTGQEDAKRALDESVYTNLAAYFEIILPEIHKYQFANSINITKGFNVMNLIGVKDEMQQLIIESVLSYVLQKERNTVVIIPEAHKFIPQGRNTPVKGTALRLIREGAAIGNYLWIDTQETTSVDKAILKQCSNWIMGYQQERNEVANVRENIGKRKIKEEDIMNLKIGHFIASLQQSIYHVYVLPAGLPEEEGRMVAMGEIPVEAVKNTLESFKPDPKYVKVPAEAPRLRSEMPAEAPYDVRVWQLKEELEKLQEEYAEYKKNTEDQEEAYRKAIDKLVDEKEQLQKDLQDTDNILEKMKEKLYRYEVFEDALSTFLKPLIPESSVKIDENVVERLIEKKINALPAKKRQRVEAPGETGIPWVDMWLPKLKTKADRAIVTLLAQKIGTPLTKTQIALALGYSEKGGSFNSALSGLQRRYKLIIKEGDTYRIAEAPV